MKPVLTDGQQASQKQLQSVLTELSGRGQAILDGLEKSRSEVLISIEQALSELNGRRQRAVRLRSPDVLGRFMVNDLVATDQSNTTATVRVDAQAVSLKERRKPAETAIRSTRFAVSSGVVDGSGGMYRVFTEDGAVPTGTFTLQLDEIVQISMIVFDTVSMPSNPSITVEASQDGVNWTAATDVSKSGYRVTAWMPRTAGRMIRIRITPSHPDMLSGSTYTFGLTGVIVQTVAFHLRSELFFHPIVIRPATPQIRLQADNSDLIQYFLSFDNLSYFEIRPGTPIQVPGSESVRATQVTLNTSGVLNHPVASNIYLSSLRVEDEAGQAMPLAYRLILTQRPRRSTITISNSQFRLAPFDEALNLGQQFNISYTRGPAAVPTWLRVRLSAEPGRPVPVFHGAHIESV